MPFEEGKSGNPNGRPKGAENKATATVKEMFVAVMEGQISYIEESLDEVRQKDPARYLDLLSKLFPYFMPKQVDISGGSGKIIEVITRKDV